LSGAGPRPPGLPEPGPETAAQVSLIQQIDREINYEVNVLNMCYGAAHNFINRWKQGQPPDAAEFAQFGGGTRTPIELAEPQIALEVYRQVRENIRSGQRAKEGAAAPKDALAIIGEGLNAALVTLAGARKA
jgi:hypothetical protein